MAKYSDKTRDKEYQTIPGESKEAPVSPEKPEIRQPTEPQEPEIPVETPERQPEEVPQQPEKQPEITPGKTDEAEERAIGKGGMEDAVKAELRNRES